LQTDITDFSGVTLDQAFGLQTGYFPRTVRFKGRSAPGNHHDIMILAGLIASR